MTTSLADAVTALRSSRPDLEVVRRGDARLVDATHDSRQVQPGWMYCAVRGATVDGHDLVDDAVAAGAAALLVEQEQDVDVPQARVPSVREAMGHVAAAIHDRPSEALRVVGVTGTNGKTTVTFLLEAAFGMAAQGTGVVGTIETRIHGVAQPGVRTTPEGTDLQRLLATMRARGVDAVAMEVSSHGLAQYRVDGTDFDVAVFTNLSQDHLDFHGTLEDYFRAKARLFTPALAQRAVICVDDDWGRRLARETSIPVLTFGRSGDADVEVAEVVADATGTRCRLRGAVDVEIRSRLLGEVNAMNAAAAYLAARESGIDPDAALTGVAACRGVPGRFEPIDGGQPFTVIVDYAHTPDALDSALTSVRKLAGAGARVHVVIGAGGDRDRGKRREMGRIAAAAGRAVLTSDNPRSEDPRRILEQVAAGARSVPGADVDVEPDRRRAIHAAIADAGPGDVVVIAGKGHETGQEIGGQVLPFDDRDVAREALAAAGWGRGGANRDGGRQAAGASASEGAPGSPA